MDIKTREEELIQRNASIVSSPKLESKLPLPARHESRTRHPSDSSSISSVNTAVKETKEVTITYTGKRKGPMKKVNLAIVKHNQRRKETGNAELLKMLDEYKRENNRLCDEVKVITREKEAIQSTVAKMLKKEEKIKHEHEANSLRMKEAENEAMMLKTICERQERELKQRDASSKSDAVRLTRQEEQIHKLRTDLHKVGEANMTLKEELRTLKDLHQKHINLKDKQIEQLLDGFQKQMQLIDVLRRQKLHLEAAHILQYTEDEFLQTLDWKPFGGNEDQPGKLVNPSG